MSFKAIAELIGTGKVKSFLHNILATGPILLGKNSYNSAPWICKIYNDDSFSGKPLNGNLRWTRKMLITALKKLEYERLLLMRAFIAKLVDSKISDYGSVSGIFKLYSKWKENGHFKKHG